MQKSDEFFVGYEAVPPGLRRHLVRVACGVGAIAVLTAVVLPFGHVRLDGGTFAFGDARPINGTVVRAPFPALRLAGEEGSAALLVAPGKHGLSLDPNATTARATATRISRAGAVMMEVVPGSLTTAHGAAAAEKEASESVDVKLTGEIVDSKCFLGVMVPGAGTTHRDCASLCLRGGIPPAFYVRDRQGASELLLLTGRSPQAVQARAVALAGSAVEISGRVTRQAGWLVLESEPSSWRPIE